MRRYSSSGLRDTTRRQQAHCAQKPTYEQSIQVLYQLRVIIKTIGALCNERQGVGGEVEQG